MSTGEEGCPPEGRVMGQSHWSDIEASKSGNGGNYHAPKE